MVSQYIRLLIAHNFAAYDGYLLNNLFHEAIGIVAARASAEHQHNPFPRIQVKAPVTKGTRVLQQVMPELNIIFR